MAKPKLAEFRETANLDGSVCEVCDYYIEGRGTTAAFAELQHRVEHLEGKHGYEEEKD